MSEHKVAPRKHNEVYTQWRTDGEFDISSEEWSDSSLDGFKRVSILPAVEFLTHPYGEIVTPKDVNACFERVIQFMILHSPGGLQIGDIITYGTYRVLWAALCLPYSAPDYDNQVLRLPGRLDKLIVIPVKKQNE